MRAPQVKPPLAAADAVLVAPESHDTDGTISRVAPTTLLSPGKLRGSALQRNAEPGIPAADTMPAPDVAEFGRCVRVCRTNSMRLVGENQYPNPRHHCTRGDAAFAARHVVVLAKYAG